MIRNTRTLIVLCLLAGVPAAILVGWATGFFTWALATGTHLWVSLQASLNSPLSIEQVVAGAGVVLAPIVLLVALFALADG